jgi:hypothetical protein
MSRVRTRITLLVGIIFLGASCAATIPMSNDDLLLCVDRTAGSLGGSSNLISSLALGLPDVDTSLDGQTADEVEAAFDKAFTEAYGIHVDEFLALRDDADATATAEFGEPPRVGELVSDEWFVERDAKLMTLWNDRYPASARAYCDSLGDGAAEAP